MYFSQPSVLIQRTVSRRTTLAEIVNQHDVRHGRLTMSGNDPSAVGADCESWQRTRRLTHHRDPFDRLLIAQAMTEDMLIVTRDRIFQGYPVRLLPC